MKFNVSGYVYIITDFVVEASSEIDVIKKSFDKELVRLENLSITDYEKIFIYNGDFTF